MNLSNRSKLSLFQFLSEMPEVDCETLCQKHTLITHPPGSLGQGLEGVKQAILHGSYDQIGGLLREVLCTSQSIRSNINPKYRFDERWRDLRRRLELDGYRVKKDEDGVDSPSFVPVDSSIPEVAVVRDDLETELKNSKLTKSEEVSGFLDKSEEAFVKADYNGCLFNARLALETLGKTIGESILPNAPQRDFGDIKWGTLISDLLKDEFIENTSQEAGLTGVYSFVSLAAHKPVGLSEAEFARLGRVLVVGLCHFLIKQFNSRADTML